MAARARTALEVFEGFIRSKLAGDVNTITFTVTDLTNEVNVVFNSRFESLAINSWILNLINAEVLVEIDARPHDLEAVRSFELYDVIKHKKAPPLNVAPRVSHPTAPPKPTRLEVFKGAQFKRYHDQLIFELYAMKEMNAKEISLWLRDNEVAMRTERGVRKVIRRIEKEYSDRTRVKPE